jgi:hypothetical protein
MKLGTLILLGVGGYLIYRYYQNASSLTVTTTGGVTTLKAPSLTNANPQLNLSSWDTVAKSIETGIYGWFYNKN